MIGGSTVIDTRILFLLPPLFGLDSDDSSESIIET